MNFDKWPVTKPTKATRVYGTLSTLFTASVLQRNSSKYFFLNFVLKKSLTAQ